MAVDTERCIGCWTCAVICKSENDVPLGLWWNRILTRGEELDTPEGEYRHLEMCYMPARLPALRRPALPEGVPDLGDVVDAEHGIPRRR